MRNRSVLTIVLVLLVAASPIAALAGETAARGDVEFYLDSAVFRTSDGGALQEVYLRFSNAEVRFKSSGGKLEARAMISVLIQDRDGHEIVKDDREHKFYAEDEREATSGLDFQTLILRYPLAAGEYLLSCALQDLNSPKVTIVGMVKGQVRSSVVEKYPLEVPVFSTENMTLSDAEFLWDVRRVGEQVVYNPNPSRLYGLYKDSLQVYIEAYVPREVAESGDLQLRSEILDEKGEIASESSIEVPMPSATEGDAGPILTFPLVISADLNRFPAGKYTQYVHVGLANQSLVRVPVGSFSVAWDMRVWETTRRNFLVEAQFLIGDEDDFDSFATKSTGEQEAILSAMWKELDPDTNTGVNEAYEKYIERVTYVSARFVDYQLGIFTDRGLIYLKYGPPDDKIVDVLPANRESASDAFEVVRDRFHTVNFSVSGGRAGYSTPSRDIIVDPRRASAVGEGGNVAFPYELWIYLGSGDTIRERDQNMEASQGLRFIFVDREGWGRYKLESSSAMVPK